MTVLSIQVLQEHLYVLEGSKNNQGGGPNQRPRGEALRSISDTFSHPVSAALFPLAQLATGSRKTNEQKLFEAQRPCNPTTRQAGKKNEKMSEKRRVENKSTREQRKRSSARMKVYPVGNSLRADDVTQRQEDNAKIHESLESAQNAMTFVDQEKQAWGSVEVIDIDEEEKTMMVAKELKNTEGKNEI